MENLLNGLNKASVLVHQAAVDKGFYDRPVEVGTLLMLINSELCEALEADRKKIKLSSLKLFDLETNTFGKDPVYAFELHVKDGFEDEIADAIIRLLDLCGYREINIQRHIAEKLKYNLSRAYKHGKSY